MEPTYVSAFPGIGTTRMYVGNKGNMSGKKRLVPKHEKYVWVTVGDDKVRPEHEALDGEVRTWYDTPHPGEEYGCRCHAESVD